MDDIKRVAGAADAPLVQLPERNLPGVVIQHDGINNVLCLVRNAKDCLQKNDWDELRDLLEEIDSLVSGYVSVFKDTQK